MSNPKLKILCLHGYRQNGDVFRMKTGSLRKMLKNHADLFYLTAPHRLQDLNNDTTDVAEEDVSDQRSWWFTTENRTYESKVFSTLCLGFEESLQLVEKALKENGPFDGVLGFSQGASFLSLICAMLHHRRLHGNFKFAIFFAGFKSRHEGHQELYKDIIRLPSLHIIGETDAVIAKEMSEGLAKGFDSPVIVHHPGGHYVPASGPQKESYISFLNANKTSVQHFPQN